VKKALVFICYIFLLPNIIKAQFTTKSPKKASIYSAVIPGAGQFYTKKYWKIPIIYAGLITSANYIKINQEQYLLYKKTYTDRLDGVNTDEFISSYNNNELINLVEFHKRNRDISILLFSVAYLLNIVDASANAHLFNYDISEEIGFQLKPSYYTNNNFPGIVLSIKF
tara:strand:- start:196 stop:699 length:504 start_codon:yes stop_codon:yes gene_type:complete